MTYQDRKSQRASDLELSLESFSPETARGAHRESPTGADVVAQWVKALLAKPDDLSLTTQWKQRTNTQKFSVHSHTTGKPL